MYAREVVRLQGIGLINLGIPVVSLDVNANISLVGRMLAGACSPMLDPFLLDYGFDFDQVGGGLLVFLLISEFPLLGLALLLLGHHNAISWGFVRVVRRVMISWSRTRVRRRLVNMIKGKRVKVGSSEFARILEELPLFCFPLLCGYEVLAGFIFVVLSGQGNFSFVINPLLCSYGLSLGGCRLALLHPFLFNFGEDAAGLLSEAACVRILLKESV